MPAREVLAGLDIGTTKIACLVAEIESGQPPKNLRYWHPPLRRS